MKRLLVAFFVSPAFSVAFSLTLLAAAIAGILLHWGFSAFAWGLILGWSLVHLPGGARSCRKYARRIACAFRGHRHHTTVRSVPGLPPCIETTFSCRRCDDYLVFNLTLHGVPEEARLEAAPPWASPN